MLIKQINKNYALQIANIFCEGSGTFCSQGVKGRIINGFSDVLFADYFLLHLDSARYFALSISHAPSSEGFIKYVIGGFDIVTGKNKTMMIDGIPGGQRSDIAWVFNVHLNNYYQSQNIPYHAKYLGKVGSKYILQISMPNNYGIVFVPGAVGGGSGGSGGSGIIKKQPPAVVPPVPQQEPIAAGFDVGTILSNPMVLIGGAALLFFYFMND